MGRPKLDTRPDDIEIEGRDHYAIKAKAIALYLGPDDLTHEEIARRLNVTPRSVYRYVQGQKVRDVHAMPYIQNIVENCLLSLADLSEKFRLHWWEWVDSGKVDQAHDVLRLFDRLSVRVKDLAEIGQMEAPELPQDPRLGLGEHPALKAPPEPSMAQSGASAEVVDAEFEREIA